MRNYKQVLPIWCLYIWIPINIYLTYLPFSGSRGVGYALPVIFVAGFVGSAITFLLIDIILWKLFVDKDQSSNNKSTLTPDQIRDYQYSPEEIAARETNMKTAKRLRAAPRLFLKSERATIRKYFLVAMVIGLLYMVSQFV